mmetsp:Transcript_54267/g.150974  ORF Transcript_54267/g.150974 Transcript_54267/m.150974 type:complete len:137 (+) Transcript_54267:167-577(+)
MLGLPSTPYAMLCATLATMGVEAIVQPWRPLHLGATSPPFFTQMHMRSQVNSGDTDSSSAQLASASTARFASDLEIVIAAGMPAEQGVAFANIEPDDGDTAQDEDEDSVEERSEAQQGEYADNDDLIPGFGPEQTQ